MAPTATETSEIETLLTTIRKEDLDGSIAQLRAAVHVFAKNPKPAIAENAKNLVESIANKSKLITEIAATAQAALKELEQTFEARAQANVIEREQQWSAYANHLKEQLTACMRDLTQIRGAQAQSPTRQIELTREQKMEVRETIRKLWSQLQNPIAYLLKQPYVPTIENIKQAIYLDKLGIPPQVHEVIYYATLNAVLDEGTKWRAKGPNAGLYDHIYNVHREMMDAVGF